MRLWHEALIPYLPQKQLCGLHREVCALRGNGWGKKHSTVNYVFEHPYGWLVGYHAIVVREMERRGYHVDPLWKKIRYRGKKARELESVDVILELLDSREAAARHNAGLTIYPEHNDAYLQECLDNLAGKGIFIGV